MPRSPFDIFRQLEVAGFDPTAFAPRPGDRVQIQYLFRDLTKRGVHVPFVQAGTSAFLIPGVGNRGFFGVSAVNRAVRILSAFPSDIFGGTAALWGITSNDAVAALGSYTPVDISTFGYVSTPEGLEQTSIAFTLAEAGLPSFYSGQLPSFGTAPYAAGGFVGVPIKDLDIPAGESFFITADADAANIVATVTWEERGP